MSSPAHFPMNSTPDPVFPSTSSPPCPRSPSAPHRSETAPPPLARPMSDHSPTPTVPPPQPTPLGQNELSPPSSGAVTPSAYPSALRRTPSSLSSGEGSTPGSREKKRLRFTPLPEAGPSSLGLTDRDGDVFHPDASTSRLEEGMGVVRGRKGVPRDQAYYLRSDPGTPNLSET